MSPLIEVLQQARRSKTAEIAAAAPLPTKNHELELEPHSAGRRTSLHEEEATLPKGYSHSACQAAAVSRDRPGHGAGASRMIWLGGVFLLLLGSGFNYYLAALEPPAWLVARSNAPLTVVQKETPGVTENAAPQPAALEMPTIEPKPPVIPPVKAQQAPLARAEEMLDGGEIKAEIQTGQEAFLKVIRSRTSTASVSDDVMAGYRAYLAGNDAAAGRQYRQAAQIEPRNVDAWLGLGAVALRQGKADEASACYMRVLELEPKNPAAQIGLISQMGQSDPAAGEGRLKTLLAQQPEAAFLHAALGNLYADQELWPSAQQAYFEAYRFDSNNAEYAFNLAVSLDQMGKADLALTYYQRAQELLPQQGGAVDLAQLDARIVQLRQDK